MPESGPIIVVFGITGDLSRRKLLPALYHLLRQGTLPASTRIVGISRRALTTDALLETVELCVLEKDKVCDPEGIQKVRAALSTIQLDPANESDYPELVAHLSHLDPDHTRQLLFYMSVPSEAFGGIIKNLAACQLNGPHSRLLIEKPFGHDLQSAEDLLALTKHAFSEQQTYRIDHYLAKETAQNLLTFRMHNPIFSPLWNAQHIESVRIRALEQIGIEGRADFYEQTGALRDLVQSHLLQLLAITLMDAPADMSAESVHASKQFFLQQIEPADPDDAVRGQYDGYSKEVNNSDSFVETYSRVRLRHRAERWQDTEFILETGKGLAAKTTDITVVFQQPHEPRRNNLTFRLQPNEGITLDLMVKEPGFANRMHHAALDFHYSQTFDSGQVDAYERVLMDAINGDQALFASDQEILATWRILQPLLDAWQTNGNGLRHYPMGSKTPIE